MPSGFGPDILRSSRSDRSKFRGYSSMVECWIASPDVRIRLPLPAPIFLLHAEDSSSTGGGKLTRPIGEASCIEQQKALTCDGCATRWCRSMVGFLFRTQETRFDSG